MYIKFWRRQQNSKKMEVVAKVQRLDWGGNGMLTLKGQGDAFRGRNILFIYCSDDFMAVKLHFPKLQILQ